MAIVSHRISALLTFLPMSQAKPRSFPRNGTQVGMSDLARLGDGRSALDDHQSHSSTVRHHKGVVDEVVAIAAQTPALDLLWPCCVMSMNT